MTKEELAGAFAKRFNREPEYIFFCPGRVNLIGEHIDYNGGKVMPVAISPGTFLAVSRNTDKKLRFGSLNFPEKAVLQLQSSYSKSGKAWYNYPLGVINEIVQQENAIPGMDLLYFGDLPVGAGLSSSASIEVLTGFAVCELAGIPIDRIELARMSKHAENSFIGVNCGIMDQFAVAMGKEDHAILLDCDTLDYEYLPFDTGPFQLVVINSNKPRSLAESKYNERFAECGAVLKLLKQEMKINNLCEANMAGFELHRHLVSDPVLQKRALHVISEQARVTDATIALQTRDLLTFGKLLYASHASLRDNYEVSCRELDTIVDWCIQERSCIGARMTGAGFGGCAIALVAASEVEDFSRRLSQHYHSVTGYEPGIFPTLAGTGVRCIFSA